MLLYGICYDNNKEDYKFSYRYTSKKQYDTFNTSKYYKDYKYKIDLPDGVHLNMWIGIEDLKWLDPRERDDLISKFIDILCENHSKISQAKGFSQFSLWLIIQWLDCFNDIFVQHFNNCVERNYNTEKIKHSVKHTPIEVKRFDVSLMQLIPFVVTVGSNCYKIVIEPNLKKVEITKNESVMWKTYYEDRNEAVQRGIAICNLMAELEA